MAPRILTLFHTDSGDDAINAGGVTFDVFVKTLDYFHERTPVSVKLAQLFRAYDVDGDGVISERDLHQMLKYYTGPHLSDATCRVLVRKTMANARARCQQTRASDERQKKGRTDANQQGTAGCRSATTRHSSTDDSGTPSGTTAETDGLTLEEFSRVVSLDGITGLDIPIQS